MSLARPHALHSQRIQKRAELRGDGALALVDELPRSDLVLDDLSSMGIEGLLELKTNPREAFGLELCDVDLWIAQAFHPTSWFQKHLQQIDRGHVPADIDVLEDEASAQLFELREILNAEAHEFFADRNGKRSSLFNARRKVSLVRGFRRRGLAPMKFLCQLLDPRLDRRDEFAKASDADPGRLDFLRSAGEFRFLAGRAALDRINDAIEFGPRSVDFSLLCA